MSISLFDRKKGRRRHHRRHRVDRACRRAASKAQATRYRSCRASRFGWLVLAIGFGGFMLWAGMAPLDQGVPSSGQVVVTGNRKTVQNLSPGLVEAILVKDGDEVSSGDVLVRLDPTTARSQYEVAYSQWLVAKAAEARLLADVRGSRKSSFRRVAEAAGRSRGRLARWPSRRSSCGRARPACRRNSAP
jgi:protease secretion system membrane fusion protein